MQIIGIDPAANKLALCSTNPLFMEKRILGKKFDPSACGQAMGWAISILSKLPREDDSYVFIEAGVVARGRIRSSIVQAHVSGAVQGGFTGAGATVYLVHPSTWKTALTGKPTASKEEVSGWLEAAWPSAWRMARGDADLVDAAAIAIYGRRVLERSAVATEGIVRP